LAALLNLADAYFAAGDRAKAKDYGAKAVAAASDGPIEVKKYVEGRVKSYPEKDKD